MGLFLLEVSGSSYDNLQLRGTSYPRGNVVLQRLVIYLTKFPVSIDILRVCYMYRRGD